MLTVENLQSHYGRIQALKGVSVDIAEGEIVALVGGNGAGKTTLLRTISGVQPATAGCVRFDGRDVTKLAPHKRVGIGIAQVPEGRQVFAPLSVEDNLRLGAFRRKDKGVAADLDHAFGLFPVLREKRHLPAGALSGGQQQMLAIGRALMSKPRLMLLDEPSMGLAPILVDQIMQVIAGLKSDGVTVFLVEQNAYAALSVADRGYVLETGAVTLSGSGAELLADTRVREAYLGV